LAAFRIYFSFF